MFVGLFVYTKLFQNLKISRKKPQNVVVFARSACIFEGSMHSQNKNGWMKMIDVGNTYFDTLLLNGRNNKVDIVSQVPRFDKSKNRMGLFY